MRYSKIRKYDVANGPGVRVTLFVTGCHHNCPGCFNKELQDFNEGKLWDEKVLEKILKYVDDDNVVGVNILGGEPLEQTMDNSLSVFLSEVKKKNKSVWLWTGFIFEDVVKDSDKYEIIKHCDVIVDGPFIQDKRNIKLKYRGSSNQRVIDVKKTLEEGNVVLHEFEE